MMDKRCTLPHQRLDALEERSEALGDSIRRLGAWNASVQEAGDMDRARIMALEQRLLRIEGYLEAEDGTVLSEPVDYDEQDRMAFESEKIERQGKED